MGIVTADWRSSRRIGRVELDQSLRFVDLTAAETMHHLHNSLAAVAAPLGFTDIDISAMTGATPQHRMLTQEIARWIYEQVDDKDEPKFAGVRYMSRLNPEWELWAVFDRRMRVEVSYPPQRILADDSDLMAVASLFDLRVEIFGGQYIEPAPTLG